MKLVGVDNDISSYKTSILELWFWRPEVRLILWPHHNKAVEKCSTTKRVLFISRFFYIRPLVMTHMHFLPINTSFGSFEGWPEGYEVKFVFCILLLIEWLLEHCSCSNVFPLHRRNDWYAIWPNLAHQMTLHDFDLRSSFDINLLTLKCKYYDASRRGERDSVQIMSLAFLVQKSFTKNNFLIKTLG